MSPPLGTHPHGSTQPRLQLPPGHFLATRVGLAYARGGWHCQGNVPGKASLKRRQDAGICPGPPSRPSPGPTLHAAPHQAVGGLCHMNLLLLPARPELADPPTEGRALAPDVKSPPRLGSQWLRLDARDLGSVCDLARLPSSISGSQSSPLRAVPPALRTGPGLHALPISALHCLAAPPPLGGP